MPKNLLTSKQKEFIRNCNHRYNIKEGAIRSGKTYMDLLYTIPYRVLNAKEDGLIFFIGNTQGTLETNILKPMRDIYGDQLVGTINRSSSEIKLFGKTVYAVGADKVSAVKRVHGSTVSYCYADEITTWNEDVFNEIKGRLSAPGACLDGTCNPDSPNHWFLKFLEDEKVDLYRQKYLLSDNKENLDPDYFENIQLEYKGTVYYNRYILGEWALAEGLVYQNFNPNTDVLEEVPEELTGDYCISCDYGTSNPCVFLLFEKGKSGTWYITREYYYSGRETGIQKTDFEYVQDFLEFFCDMLQVPYKYPYNLTLFDPSAASIIAALRKEGVKVKKAKNDVLNGIRLTASALVTGKLKILKCCTNTIREMSSYCWNKKANKDEPLKEDDHCPDAIRYFVNTILDKEEKLNRKVNFLK